MTQKELVEKLCKKYSLNPPDGMTRQDILHDAAITKAVVNNEKMWDNSLSSLEGFEDAVAGYLALIHEKGMYEAMKEIQK